MTAPDERAAFVAGLRELADFVESHTDLPVPPRSTVRIHPRGTDEDEREQVDRIAKILGAAPQASDDGDYYQATRTFGPVAYEAIAITHESMERYKALMTYGDAVQPERSAS